MTSVCMPFVEGSDDLATLCCRIAPFILPRYLTRDVIVSSVCLRRSTNKGFEGRLEILISMPEYAWRGGNGNP